MDNDEFLILRSGEATGLVTPAEALDAIEDAWRDYATHRQVLSNPPALGLQGQDARFKVKGAVLPGAGLAGFRMIADAQAGAQDWFWLADAVTGRPLAMMDEYGLHCLRTAATGALAARMLARPGATRAALIGAGRIAAQVPACLAAALPGLTDLHVAARRAEAVEEFVAKAPKDLSLALHAAPSIAEAVRDADIVITITSATETFLDASMVKPGATVIGLGDVELNADLLGWANRFVVDDLVFALTIGNVGAWIGSKALTAEAVTARLDADVGEIVGGMKPGRVTDSDNVLAIIQGMAIGDLALAVLAWRKARLRRLGIRVGLGAAPNPHLRGPTPRRNRALIR
ncbi:ornithine cyclodeaminase family protein [Falsiroseomonas ponticola]|uniref:ornithine cyclodeaminase family protein n=1 Tax=Falsiroseomonas ponticola TaxID=2786951 RepID=UPI001933A847|nr:ornithine cyclodeaminase family protein [Roseomonas ponticola]